MAIQVDTTSVPGSTIVYDDSNGGVIGKLSRYQV